MATNQLGIPLVLLFTTWGVLTPVLKFIEMTNDRRDKILDPESKLTKSHRKLMFHSDWVTLCGAMYGYSFLMGSVILFYPYLYADKEGGGLPAGASLICSLTGLVIVVSTCVGAESALKDYRFIRRYLDRLTDD